MFRLRLFHTDQQFQVLLSEQAALEFEHLLLVFLSMDTQCELDFPHWLGFKVLSSPIHSCIP